MIDLFLMPRDYPRGTARLCVPICLDTSPVTLEHGPVPKQSQGAAHNPLDLGTGGGNANYLYNMTLVVNAAAQDSATLLCRGPSADIE